MQQMFSKHFRSSQFQKCINILEESKVSFKTFSEVSLSSELNYEICKLLQALIRQKTDGNNENDSSVIIENGKNALEKLLTTVQSLPPSQEWIGLEVTVVYNLIYCQLLLGNLRQCDWLAVLKRSTTLLKHSLNRVKAALTVSGTVIFPARCEGGVVELIEDLAHVTDILRVNNVACSFSLVSCVYTLILMYYGNLQEARRCLEALSPLVKYHTDLLNLHPQMGMLVFSSDCTEEGTTPTNALKLTDVIHFCTGLCYFKLKQSAECKNVLSKISFTPWTPHAAYLTVSSLLSEELYLEALLCVNSVLNEDPPSESDPLLTARLFYLQGSCFHKLKLHHCAVAALKQCLDRDPTACDALWDMARLYRHFGLVGEELDVLNLVVKIVQSETWKRCDSAKPCLGALFTGLFAVPSVTPRQALYSLASRYKQLGRFTEASEKYLSLLAAEGEFVSVSPQKNGTVLGELPDAVTMYTECAHCLLRSGRFQECVAVCMQAVDVHSPAVFTDVCSAVSSLSASGPEEGGHTNDDDDDDDDDDVTGLLRTQNGSRTRKRRRSESFDSGETLSCRDVERHMKLVFYEADALVQCNDAKRAADLLYRSIEHLLEYYKQIQTSRQNMSCDDHRTGEVGSAAKRQRRNEGLVEDTVKSASSGTEPTKVQRLLSEGCTHLASIFLRLESLPDALHYGTLAVQLDSKNTSAWFRCSQVLQKHGRQHESVTSWLQHRHICHQSDSFQLANELRRKQENLRSLTEEDCEKIPALLIDPVPLREVLKMDISSLEYLLKYQQSKHSTY